MRRQTRHGSTTNPNDDEGNGGQGLSRPERRGRGRASLVLRPREESAAERRPEGRPGVGRAGASSEQSAGCQVKGQARAEVHGEGFEFQLPLERRHRGLKKSSRSTFPCAVLVADSR